MGNVTSTTLPTRLNRYVMGGLFVLIVGLGAWFSFEAGTREDEAIRRELLRQACSVASTLSQENIRALSFTAEDTERPEFQRLTAQLRAYSETTGIRSIYTMRLRDGQLFFGPESLLPGDPYATPPGTIYQEPSPQNLEIFRTAEPVVFGPVSDEFGEFLSAIVPIVDPRSGEVLMVLGQDFEAADWSARIHKAQMIPLLAILCPMGMLLLGYLAFKTCKRTPWCNPKRLRNIQIVTYFLVMLQLTVIAFMCIRDIEIKEQTSLFNAEAAVKSQYYRETFSEIQRDLHLLVNFFEASESVTHEEFSSFCQTILENNPIKACFWLPEWSATNASICTIRIQTEGLPDFSIRRFANDNRPAREFTGPIFPAVYVEPSSQRPATLGYDFYSDPALRDALSDTLQSELVSACFVSARTPNTTEPSGLFVFEPVSHPRQSGLIGFCISTDEVIEFHQSDPSREIPALSATLFELQSGKSPHPLSCSDCEHDSPECLKMLESDLSATIPIFAFGKSFVLLCTAEPQWFTAHPQYAAVITLVAGLGLTLLLSCLFAVLINRPHLLEQQVHQRTSELAESKERFDIAISAANLGVWERDVASGKLIWNERMLEIYGIRKDEFDGDFHKWREYIHPDDHERVARELTESETGERRFNSEFRIIRPDGGIRHILAFGKMIRDVSGEPPRMIGINQDITDLKMAQESAAQEQEQLQFIFDALPIGISLNRTRPDGREIRMINDAHLRIAGIRRDQDNPESWRRANHPDNHDEQDAFESEMDGGKIKHFTVDKRYVHPDGRIVWVAFSRRRKMLDDGGFEDLCTVVDITERKEAAEKLRQSEAVLQAAMDNSQAGIAIADAPDGKLRYVNEAGLLIRGDSDKELVENVGIEQYVSSWQILHLDGTPYRDEEVPLARAVLFGEVCSEEFIIRRSDNQERTVWANAAPIRNEDGEIVSAILVFLDITELKRTEDKLRSTEAFLNSVIDQSPFPMWLADLNGTIIRTNDALCRTLGIEKEEIRGKYNILKDHNLEKNGMLEQVKRVFEQQEVVHLTTLWKAEQSGVPLSSPNQDIYVQATIIPVTNQEGRLTHIACQWVDITERKKAEEALKESEELFRSMINDLQVGVVMHAEDSSIALSNPAACRMLGLTAEQITGKTATDPIWKFVREDGSKMSPEEFPVMRVMSTGKSISNQIVGIMTPGQTDPTWIIANAVRVFSDNNFLFRIIVNFMDITAMKIAEENLLARNDDLERFNKASVGRELRMIELKKEINALYRKLGKPAAYALDLDRDVTPEPLR